MSLAAGSRLGPYEIVAPLGAGGMGEVYRARDTRLGREVAIKVLPAGLSADPERLKRFEREARSASSLNHPNIVTIHDIGSEGGVSYIAMELVKGEPLRMELAGGALPVKKMLQIGAQIAEGLAKAHAAGIVHRDLKPENVMLTEDGHVKILDFGLASRRPLDAAVREQAAAAQDPMAEDPLSVAPTVEFALTEEGVVLGTVGYMSPEQAAGRGLDFRSDQFSLGSILYEMATGRRAFQRESSPETLAAIIRDEPEPIAAANAAVPVPVRWTIERCLAKQARDRYASTEDLARDLATVRDRLSEAASAVAIAPPSAPRPRRGLSLAAAFAAGLLVAGLGAVVWHSRSANETRWNPLSGARFTRLTDWEGSELDAAISDDGKFVAFLSDREGRFDAWVTQIGSGEFVNLTRGQFPDMLLYEVRNVGFADDDSHVSMRISQDPSSGRTEDSWLIPTLGGTGRPFLRAALEVAWSPDRTKTVYHTPAAGDPIFVGDRTAANAVKIYEEKAGIHNHFQTWSPDGRYIYFVRGIPTTFDMDIWRIPAAGGTAERLTSHHSHVTYPTFLDARTLLYAATRPDGSGSGIYAMDLGRRVSRLVSFGVEDYLSVAATRDGRRLVAVVGNPASALAELSIGEKLLDDSAVRKFALPSVRAAAPRYGPDYLLYLSSRGGPDGLWKWKDGVATELWKPSGGYVAAAPAISFDGSRIAFVVNAAGKGQLFVMASDGTNPHPIGQGLDFRDAPSWSPDGKWIAAAANDGGGAQPLFRIPVDGGSPERIVEGVAYSPVWSPDGKFIAFAEGRGGRTLRLKGITPDRKSVPLPELTMARNGNRLRFLPDGKSLIVMQGEINDQNFSRLDIASQRLTPLTDLKPGFQLRSFDVSPDGKTILFDRYRENSDIVLIDLPSGSP
ncbi:MAG TPA: protein kinase [Thermoanaerobaculia bacterium]